MLKKTKQITLIIAALVVATGLLLSACGGGASNNGGNGGNGDNGGGNGDNGGGDGDNGGGNGATAIVMITPYVDSADMQSVEGVFSSEHSGLDFVPTGDLKSFRAVSDGTIQSIELLQNEISGKWEVRILIVFNATYSVLYAFEPFSLDSADGQTQLANIMVTEGQVVSQGDVIGKLLTVGEGAHVHFGLFDTGSDGICPEIFFTAEARESVIALIHSTHPDWSMCE
jgi:hypothetical protein